MAFFDNTRKPTGIGGEIMVSMMNFGHRALADLGFRFLDLNTNAKVMLIQGIIVGLVGIVLLLCLIPLVKGIQ